MSGINKVILVGRLGTDPEVKELTSNGKVCKFSVATSESWTKDGTKQEKTEWHRIVVWGKLAELCGLYLAKGKQVYVEGKLQTSSYEKDGVTKYSTDIIANNVQFLSSTSVNQEVARGVQNHAPGASNVDPSFDSAEEIPF